MKNNFGENFWKKLREKPEKTGKPFFILAPMEAVTDVVFRETVAEAARISARKNGDKIRENLPDAMMTEFTNSTSFCSKKGEKSTRGRLFFAPDEIENGRNLIAQIWGNNAENFREMTKKIFAKNFSGVDVNMGCPDKSVVKNGAGSGLITEKNRANAVKILYETQNGFYDFLYENNEKFREKVDEKIAKELREKNLNFVKNDEKISESLDEIFRETLPQNEIPVSVKTRLGATKINEFREWLPLLFREKPANLTIHLRTRKEMSKVPAHFELIPEIAKIRDEISPQTLLMINGDILTRKMGEKLREKYPEIDGIMIGRGIFNNPFAFTKIENPTREELFELLKFQLKKYDEFREIPGTDFSRKFDPLKHFFKIYTNGFSGAKKLREKMMAAKTTDEVREILREFEKNNR